MDDCDFHKIVFRNLLPYSESIERLFSNKEPKTDETGAIINQDLKLILALTVTQIYYCWNNCEFLN